VASKSNATGVLYQSAAANSASINPAKKRSTTKWELKWFQNFRIVIFLLDKIKKIKNQFWIFFL
jgi:hypothetical protein